jgi:hypothetical protein
MQSNNFLVQSNFTLNLFIRMFEMFVKNEEKREIS